MVAMLGPEDMGVVLVVVAVVAIFTFGSSKIPQLARSLGQAKSEFKKGLSERPDEQQQDEQQQASAKAADSQNNGKQS
jgi:TatA/E family protein of Tat protein translocase